MAKSKVYKGFANAEEFLAELWGVKDIPTDDLLAKDKDGKHSVFCPDGKIRELRIGQGNDGAPTYTLSETEVARPKRSLWDRFKSFFGFGEKKEDFEARQRRYDRLGGANKEQLLDDYGKEVRFDGAAEVQKKVNTVQQAEPEAPAKDEEGPFYDQLRAVTKSQDPAMRAVARAVTNGLKVLQEVSTGVIEANMVSHVAANIRNVAAFRLLISSEEAKADFYQKLNREAGVEKDKVFNAWASNNIPTDTITKQLSGQEDQVQAYVGEVYSSYGENIITNLNNADKLPYSDVDIGNPLDLTTAPSKASQPEMDDGDQYQYQDWCDQYTENGIGKAAKDACDTVYECQYQAEYTPKFLDSKKEITAIQTMIAFRMINTTEGAKKSFDNMVAGNTDPNVNVLEAWAKKNIPDGPIKDTIPKNAEAHAKFLAKIKETGARSVMERIQRKGLEKAPNEPVISTGAVRSQF